MFDLLDEFGEEEDLENWVLVDEREVDYEQEEALDKMIGLASTGTARPNAKSDLDGETESQKKFIVSQSRSAFTAFVLICTISSLRYIFLAATIFLQNSLELLLTAKGAY